VRRLTENFFRLGICNNNADDREQPALLMLPPS
jgi:hypothetical protein